MPTPALKATLVAVHLLSRIGTEGPATPDVKHVRQDEIVLLHAVLAFQEDGKTVYYSDAGEIRVPGGKKTVTARPLADAPETSLRWYKVEPSEENLSNTASGSFAFEEIPYAETALEVWNDVPIVVADVRPVATTDRGNGLGTMRYKLVASDGEGHEVSTPGAEARRGRGAGGLATTVHQVSIRRDDTYLGWLTELYGQPYIWASAGTSAKAHQSERLEGADCADFITYGWRRLGHDVPYTWTEGLRKYTKRLAAGTANDEGVYLDKKGKPIAFPNPGDLVLFPRHVGALVEDRGTIGVLDTADVMAHTLFESPHEEPIEDSGYTVSKIEVLRWKD